MDSNQNSLNMLDVSAYLNRIVQITDPFTCIDQLIVLVGHIYKCQPHNLEEGRVTVCEILPIIIGKILELESGQRGKYENQLSQISNLFKISRDELKRMILAEQTRSNILSQQTSSVLSTPAYTQQFHEPAIDLYPREQPIYQQNGNRGNTSQQHLGICSEEPEGLSREASEGEKIAGVLRTYGHPSVVHLPHDFSKSARFFKFCFAYGDGASFEKIKPAQKELLQAGYIPEIVQMIQVPGDIQDKKPRGRIEIHAPRETEEYCLYLKWLFERTRGPSDLSVEEGMRWLLKNVPKAKPDQILETTFGLDLNNKPIKINHEEGVFSVGGPGSGKSTSYTSRITEGLIFRGSDLLEIYAISMKRSTFKPFQGLIHIINDADKVSAFLEAVKRESEERDNEFARVGVNCIQQYNVLAMSNGSKVMPYIWILIDEILALKKKCPPELLKQIEELSGFTRSSGIYWDIGTQYPSESYAVTVPTRSNLSEKILFSCAEQGADLVIPEREAKNLAPSLLKKGDALLKVSSRKKLLTRAQGFYIPDVQTNNQLWVFMSLLRQSRPPLSPSRLLSGNSNESTPFGGLGGDMWDVGFSQETSTILQEEREKQKWNLVAAFCEYNKQKTEKKIANRRLYVAVYGDIIAPECKNDPIETIEDLIKTPVVAESDPRTKVYTNAGNEASAKKYIAKLEEMFGKTQFATGS